MLSHCWSGMAPSPTGLLSFGARIGTRPSVADSMSQLTRISAGLRSGFAPAAAGAVLFLAAGCGRVTTAPSQMGSGVTEVRSGKTSTSAVQPYDPSLILWSASGSASGDVEAEHDLQHIGSIGSTQICRVAAGSDPLLVAQSLVLDSRVGWAEPNYLAETAESRGHSWAFDDGFNDQQGYEDQNAAARLGLTTAHGFSTGNGVLVAVLDTGVNPGHPLLADHVVAGYDFVSNDANPGEAPDGIDNDGDGFIDEALGHGTHVAGIVALVAPGARILPLRVLDDDGHGDALSIARAIDYAVTRGARVINLSLGLLNEDRTIEDALARASARGAVIVASAGNWGAEEPEEYPANFDEAAAVAATRADDWPTTFTSFGGFVALSAPGEGIRSAFWNGHTAVWSGTSMSAPFVAGAAALLLALHPSWGHNNVMSRLRQTAKPLDPSIPEVHEYGAGRLDLAAALLAERSGGAGDKAMHFSE